MLEWHKFYKKGRYSKFSRRKPLKNSIDHQKTEIRVEEWKVSWSVLRMRT